VTGTCFAETATNEGGRSPLESLDALVVFRFARISKVLGEHEPGEAGPARDGPGTLAEELPEAGHGIDIVGGESLEEKLFHAVYCGPDDRFLRRQVTENGGIADSQAPADLLGGEAVKAIQTNDLERNVRNLLFPQCSGLPARPVLSVYFSWKGLYVS
jgi:hypothetical protein